MRRVALLRASAARIFTGLIVVTLVGTPVATLALRDPLKITAAVRFAVGFRTDAVPVHPPSNLRPVAIDYDRTIRVDVEYDEAFLAQRGGEVEPMIREALAMHSIEWRRYRNEWFELGALRFASSGQEHDASYVLASFHLRTEEWPDTIHLNIVGRPLEVYTDGIGATPIAGLSYRGSDSLLISVQPWLTTEGLAYYLFHEIGHCWEALDLPISGGDSTFGTKRKGISFDIDAGNSAIIEGSKGPGSRTTPGLATAIITRKREQAREVAGDPWVHGRLDDLLLHEPSPSNPAYRTKKAEILARAGDERAAVEKFLNRFEVSPRHAGRDEEVVAMIAGHYWQANDAIVRRDYETAALAIAAMHQLQEEVGYLHYLVSALEERVRRKR